MARAEQYTSSMSKDDATWLEKWQNPYVKLIIVCRLCNKEQKTMNTTVWKAHFLTHSDVKPYNCDICQKGFVQTTAYKNLQILTYFHNCKFNLLTKVSY